MATLPNRWQFSADRPNALPLTAWKLTLKASVVSQSTCADAKVYETTFKVATSPRHARLLMDGLIGEKVHDRSIPVHAEIRLNGEPITQFEPGRYLDHYICEADVGGLIKRGVNTLTIETSSQLYEAGSLGHPPILIGDFRLNRRQGQWVIGAQTSKEVRGSWTEFGYPFYSGIGTYRQRVALPKIKPDERLLVRLESLADLADVRVNGKSAGVIAWEPFEVDVTQLARVGRNTIEIKVANSLQNLLVMVPKDSGVVGKVEIIRRKRRSPRKVREKD